MQETSPLSGLAGHLGDASRPAGRRRSEELSVPADPLWDPACLILGSAWLFLGLVLYTVARPQTALAFLPHVGKLPVLQLAPLRFLLGPLPTFIHAVAFTLLSASVLGRTRRRLVALCASWAVIEALVEVAQHPAVRGWLLAELPWTTSLSYVRTFLRGTFDFADIAAGLCGAIAAGFIAHTAGGKMSKRSRQIVKYALLLGVFAFGAFTILASGGGGGGTPSTPTTGSISVNVGFGAVSSTPYQCTGQVTVTITPQNLTGTAGKNQPESRVVTFSGFSSTTPNEPACQQTVVFTDLRPGTWRVTDGTGVCTANVVAGQIANVKIWNGVCS